MSLVLPTYLTYFLVNQSLHHPITTFPADANMEIIIKKITETETKQEAISIKESPALVTQFTNFLSLMGSIIAAVNLYIIAKIKTFKIGNAIIKIIIIKPRAESEFFNRIEYPATEEIASDKHFPTIGTKLSTANFAVFTVT